MELFRGIRSQLTELVGGLGDQDLAPMSLGLSHSLSRYKLKFSPDKVGLCLKAILLPLCCNIDAAGKGSSLSEEAIGLSFANFKRTGKDLKLAGRKMKRSKWARYGCFGRNGSIAIICLDKQHTFDV